MDRVRRQLGCSDFIQSSIATEDITVAVLDTGIGNHPDFANRIIDFADFVNGKLGSYDDSGHGTHGRDAWAEAGMLPEGVSGGLPRHADSVSVKCWI